MGGRVGGRGGARGLGGALVDAERHHEAFVVVRVLADQVDAAGRLRERGRERVEREEGESSWGATRRSVCV